MVRCEMHDLERSTRSSPSPHISPSWDLSSPRQRSTGCIPTWPMVGTTRKCDTSGGCTETSPANQNNSTSRNTSLYTRHYTTLRQDSRCKYDTVLLQYYSVLHRSTPVPLLVLQSTPLQGHTPRAPNTAPAMQNDSHD